MTLSSLSNSFKSNEKRSCFCSLSWIGQGPAEKTISDCIVGLLTISR